MRLTLIAPALIALTLLATVGCSAPEDLRVRMERAAAPPDGVQQTQFAHIGDVETAGGTFHVVTERRILTGMSAPRGLPRRLLLFDSDARLVASYEYAFDAAEPLWCEGSCVYLFGLGSIRSIEPDPRIVPPPSREDAMPAPAMGNVIDFAAGPTAPVLTREKRYGSSGGLGDDPWAWEPRSTRSN